MTTQITKIKPEQVEVQESRSLWRDALRHILRDKLTLLAMVILLIMTLACALGPPIVENALQIDVNRTNVMDRFAEPGENGHILGADHIGRDQFIRLLYGGRVSLAIAYAASVMIILIGVSVGYIAGYFGGWLDDIIAFVINTLSSIPSLFLLLIASALWEPTAQLLIIILAALGWIGTCRLTRAEVLSIKERDYIMAARALGSSPFNLFIKHFLPNLLPIVIVTGTIIAGNLILIESGLSYLGVGVRPPTPTWGNMLTDSRSYFTTGPHLVIFPGVMIMITVLCFYLIGDGLRDALDPRTVRK